MNVKKIDESGSDRVRWIGVEDAEALQQAAYQFILDAAGHALEQRGHFLIVLAGGNTPANVYRMLREADTDWSRWQVYFGDERCLPASDAKRNSRMATDAWLDHVSVPLDQVHIVAAELGPQSAADEYAKTLRNVGDCRFGAAGPGRRRAHGQPVSGARLGRWSGRSRRFGSFRCA